MSGLIMVRVEENNMISICKFLLAYFHGVFNNYHIFIPIRGPCHVKKAKQKKLKKNMLFLEIAQLSRAPTALSQLNQFKKTTSGALSDCQTVWIQIRTNILSVFIRIQTVYKGNQQTIKVAASQERFRFD